jgi:hypothetical protein
MIASDGDDTGDDHDGRDVAIVLVVFVVLVAIVPEARQPSVIVHSEQAPRYPFSERNLSIDSSWELGVDQRQF